jgi:Domain of unknown function (DUF6883)
MAPLLHADRAILDLDKIEDYCLSPAHPRGRHKARVFREALGLGRSDAEWLRQALLDGLSEQEAAELANDNYGTRWRVDIPVTRQNRRAVVRTIWIVRSSEREPRFVTCWVL